MRGLRWRFAVLPVVSVAILTGNFMRNRDVLTQVWPMLRDMMGTSALLLVGTAALAAIAAGLVAWRREYRR